jgi:Flp pilus assembly protein TadB
MDNTMAEHDDFLKPLLDLMNRRMDTIETKVDANTNITAEVLEQARHTNGRVTKSEDDIKALQTQAGHKFNLQPSLLYLIALGAVILLVVIASLLHINLGGILK